MHFLECWFKWCCSGCSNAAIYDVVVAAVTHDKYTIYMPKRTAAARTRAGGRSGYLFVEDTYETTFMHIEYVMLHTFKHYTSQCGV